MKLVYVLFAMAILLIMIISCGKKEIPDLDTYAEDYLRLVFALGTYDDNYVDAYFGEEKYREEGEALGYKPDDIIAMADSLQKVISEIDTCCTSQSYKLRHRNLIRLLTALKAHAEYLNGTKRPFSEEAELLYGIGPTEEEMSDYDDILTELDSVIPGEGDLRERFVEYRGQFLIPKEKLDTVFKTAIMEGKKRTLEFIDLPAGENFVVEYVRDVSWGAYNWFKGNSFSLIQVNTDFPIYIDRAVDLACHEGYPGHHVYHSMLEQNIVKDSGWVEYSVYPLFSPQSLISEGTANYGIEVVFSKEDRMKYEKEVLFPLAGLDTSKADEYYKIIDMTNRLSFAGNEIARRYLDGEISRDEAVEMVMKYRLRTREHAEKNVDFYEKYRSYIINYNVGEHLVKSFIESDIENITNPDKKKEAFKKLISLPHLTGDILPKME